MWANCEIYSNHDITGFISLCWTTVRSLGSVMAFSTLLRNGLASFLGKFFLKDFFPQNFLCLGSNQKLGWWISHGRFWSGAAFVSGARAMIIGIWAFKRKLGNQQGHKMSRTNENCKHNSFVVSSTSSLDLIRGKQMKSFQHKLCFYWLPISISFVSYLYFIVSNVTLFSFPNSIFIPFSFCF